LNSQCFSSHVTKKKLNPFSFFFFVRDFLCSLWLKLFLIVRCLQLLEFLTCLVLLLIMFYATMTCYFSTCDLYDILVMLGFLSFRCSQKSEGYFLTDLCFSYNYIGCRSRAIDGQYFSFLIPKLLIARENPRIRWMFGL